MPASSCIAFDARFEFVINGGKKRSQISKHAAQECHRRRLWRRYHSALEQKPRFLVTTMSSPQTVKKHVSRNSPTRSNELALSILPRSRFQEQDHMSDDSPSQLPPTVGAYRQDSFNSYPFQISQFQEQLLDEYIHYPNCGAFDFAKDFKPQPIKILVQEAIACPILFHAVLANAAYNRLMGYCGSIEVQRVLKCELLSHKVQAIRLSNAALHSLSDKSLDSVLHTALTIAHLECKNGDRAAMLVHYRGMQGILRQVREPWLTMNHGFEMRLMIFEMAHDKPEWSFICHPDDRHPQSKETQAFLEDLCRLEISGTFPSLGANTSVLGARRTQEYVSRHSSLYYFLSRNLPTKATCGVLDLLDDNNAQLACLLLLSLTILEWRYELLQIREYVDYVEKRIIQQKLNEDASEWCIFWIIFLDVESTAFDARRRMWSVMRMMNIMKSIDQLHRKQLKQGLLQFLSDFPSDGEGGLQRVETL